MLLYLVRQLMIRLRFTIILFSWSHLRESRHYNYKVCFKLSTVGARLPKLLSSANLWANAIEMKNEKSFKKKLNKVGPTI